MGRFEWRGWYAHALMFRPDERELRVMVSRFHRWIPIVTVWWWFGDITFGHIGSDD